MYCKSVQKPSIFLALFIWCTALEEDIVVKSEYISRERIRRQVNRFQGVGKKKKKNRKKRTGYGV